MGVGNTEDYEDQYIDAISGKGGMKCYECGGLGHPARICPNRIVKDKGKGKGKGKTNDCKGKGNGSGGKGFQGTCFKCGKVVHKANECCGQARTPCGVDIEDEEQMRSRARRTRSRTSVDGRQRVGEVRAPGARRRGTAGDEEEEESRLEGHGADESEGAAEDDGGEQFLGG